MGSGSPNTRSIILLLMHLRILGHAHHYDNNYIMIVHFLDYRCASECMWYILACHHHCHSEPIIPKYCSIMVPIL